MDDLVDSSSTRSRELTTDTFNHFLVHALIVHGFAMLSTMLALIPIVLNTWRILRAQKPKVFHAIQPRTKILLRVLIAVDIGTV